MARKQKRPIKRLRVMAEYGSSGIWAVVPVGVFRHGMLEHGRLGLPADLAKRFDAWIELYEQRLDDRLDVAAFNVEGLALARALKQHVGPTIEVVYVPEAADGGREPEQVIEM